MKSFFHRRSRSASSTADKKNTVQPSSSLSKAELSARTLDTERMNVLMNHSSSLLEEALERYFSEKQLETHSLSSSSSSSSFQQSQDFTGVIPSVSCSVPSCPSLELSSVSHNYSSSYCSSSFDTGGSCSSPSCPNRMRDKQKLRQSLQQRHSFLEGLLELDNSDELDDCVQQPTTTTTVATEDHLPALPVQLSKETEALTLIATELERVRDQIQETQLLIDQRNLKIAALCFPADTTTQTIPQKQQHRNRHQVIIEMQRLLRLEAQRDCLVKHEWELQRQSLQRIMIHETAYETEKKLTTSAVHTTLLTKRPTRSSNGSSTDSTYSCTAATASTTSKSSDEIYEEALTRVEAWKLLRDTTSTSACTK